MKLRVLSLALAILVFNGAAMAESGAIVDCTADAEAVHHRASGVAGEPDFTVRFRVTPDGCDRKTCTGYVNYKISFRTRRGATLVERSLTRWYKGSDQRTAEASGTATSVNCDPTRDGQSECEILDVEVTEVSCR